MSGLDQKVSKIQMFKDPMSSYDEFINGPKTKNIAHGGALSLDTNTDDLSRTPLFSKSSKRPSKQVVKRSRTSSKRSSNQVSGNNSSKRLFCETIQSGERIWEDIFMC